MSELTIKDIDKSELLFDETEFKKVLETLSKPEQIYLGLLMRTILLCSHSVIDNSKEDDLCNTLAYISKLDENEYRVFADRHDITMQRIALASDLDASRMIFEICNDITAITAHGK